jgi:hypothetical protein
MKYSEFTFLRGISWRLAFVTDGLFLLFNDDDHDGDKLPLQVGD